VPAHVFETEQSSEQAFAKRTLVIAMVEASNRKGSADMDVSGTDRERMTVQNRCTKPRPDG
jgi:hypothetical protein